MIDHVSQPAVQSHAGAGATAGGGFASLFARLEQGRAARAHMLVRQCRVFLCLSGGRFAVAVVLAPLDKKEWWTKPFGQANCGRARFFLTFRAGAWSQFLVFCFRKMQRNEVELQKKRMKVAAIQVIVFPIPMIIIMLKLLILLDHISGCSDQDDTYIGWCLPT